MQNVEAVWKNNFLNQVIVYTAWAPGSRMPAEKRVTVDEAVFSAAYSRAAGCLRAERGTQGPPVVPCAGLLVRASPGMSSDVQGRLPHGTTLRLSSDSQ